MSRIDNKKKLRSSILDRLIDNETHVSTEVDTGRHQFQKQLRDSVRRDIENLLNTRYYLTSPPDDLPQIKNSLLNYGLPDLATVNIIDVQKRKDFTQKLEQSLQQFEPRFKHVKISYIANTDQTDRTLRFRIEATMYADPLPEVVVFDSLLESVTRTVTIKEISHG